MADTAQQRRGAKIGLGHFRQSFSGLLFIFASQTERFHRRGVKGEDLHSIGEDFLPLGWKQVIYGPWCLLVCQSKGKIK